MLSYIFNSQHAKHNFLLNYLFVLCVESERRIEKMHAVSSDRLLPVTYHVSTPSTRTSSVWRQPLSAVSSPGLSDSKEEEDMEVDMDDTSPRTDLVLRSPSDSLARHSSSTLASLSNLSISEQNNKPAPSCNKPVLLKRSQSCQIMPGEKTTRLSLNSAYSAMQSVCDRTNEFDDSDHHLSDVTQVSSSGKEQLPLVLLSEVNNVSQDLDTSKSASLLEGQHKLFSAKSFVFSVALLIVSVAVFVSYIQQSPAVHCVGHIDVDSLRHELQQRVHGQHIAVNTVIKRLEEFMSSSDKRQLVMSFHGWTGIGKNFMSSIIAQHLPPQNVHKFIIPLHFAHGTDNEALLLTEWIMSNMSYPSCGLHLFIIDEIDKISQSLLHRLHETLNRLSLQSDTSCRAVFLLLTNDGATEINTVVMEVLKNGGDREDLELVDILPRLSSEFYTEMVSSKLIDQTVPFLPLERQHVTQCIQAELKLRHVDVTQHLVDGILKSLSYFPPGVSLFSRSGCRRIVHLVDLFL